jgi:signal transduction histidine kinase
MGFQADSSKNSPSIVIAGPEDWLVGGGEMGKLLRSMDWTKTPLGPIESWPQSLRTSVSICLGSRAPIVLWWGPERWMFYNDAYRPMLGASKHPQFLGTPGQACWAEIWDIIGPMMDQVIETGEATWSEDLLLLMSRHGYLEEAYFTFSYSPIRDETGRPYGIFCACTETTARVLGERRLKTLRAMTVETRTANEGAQLCAEVLRRNARDITFALVYLLDGAGSYLHLAGNAGLEASSSASPALVSMVDADAAGWPLVRVAKDCSPELVTNLAELFDCLPKEPWDEPAHQAMLLPIPQPGLQGPADVLVLGISPRRAFDDDYRGFFELAATHVATVVSNARAFELERQRAEKRAELDRAKTAFFSNVSHEFRTPLTLMLGPLEDELAERVGPLPPARRKRLETVHRNSLRLLKLVNTLLDFSRIEAGRVQASYEPMDLAMHTAELASVFRSAVEKAGLTLTIDCPPLPDVVNVDREMWEKIVLNLLSNALKHTFEGGITVKLSWCGEHVELAVADTGVGIPEAALSRVFERFHRVKDAKSRTHEGTGIGLALVQELVSLHGGVVRVESEENKGSTFTVTIKAGTAHLPPDRMSAKRDLASTATRAAAYVEEAVQWLPNAATPSDQLPPSGEADIVSTYDETPAFLGVRRARILWADDNADMRDYVRRLLEDRYEVLAVRDGLTALSKAQEEPPDLVLSDVMMPGLDGFGLLRELRKDARTQTIPVILLSARAGEESAVEGLNAGADDYLAKPFSARELLARVRTHLELARVRKEWAMELEQANHELEAFSYSVSHDLRAPLRAIDGFSKTLLDEYGEKLDKKGCQYLDRVRSATQKMAALIEDLLNLSRITRAPLRKESIGLTVLAQGVVADLREKDPSRIVVIHIAGGLAARGDVRLVTIVLVNLIGNAWKFTAKQPEAQIAVEQEKQGHETVFSVRDNGAGFDMAYADKLFAPFQRLHQESEFEGTGIGLATVQRVISRHGGRIWAESAVGKGTTIFFTLGGAQ